MIGRVGLSEPYPNLLLHTCSSHGSLRFVSRAQVGADDEGYAVRLRYKHYLTYCRTPHHGAVDDSPLYIFDGTFADREGSKAMRKDYEVGDGLGSGVVGAVDANTWKYRVDQIRLTTAGRGSKP